MERMTENRFAILTALHEGPATVRELAVLLDVTPAQVMIALDRLPEEVEKSHTARINPDTGRAAQSYELTENARSCYPDYVKEIERIRANRGKPASRRQKPEPMAKPSAALGAEEADRWRTANYTAQHVSMMTNLPLEDLATLVYKLYPRGQKRNVAANMVAIVRLIREDLEKQQAQQS